MKSKYLFPTVFMSLLLLIVSCNNQKKTKEENVLVAKTFIESINEHDIDRLLSLFADDCLYEEVATGRRYTDKKGIAAYIESTLSGVPDSRFEITSLVADNKTAVVEWIWKGTNTTGWEDMGIPATNKYFEVRGVSVMVIEGKLILRVSDYWDWNTFLKGIGVE